MQKEIESELLSFLREKKETRKRNSNNDNNERSSNSALQLVSLNEIEDWIVIDKLHQLLCSGQSISQRALYYSFPQLYRYGGSSSGVVSSSSSTPATTNSSSSTSDSASSSTAYSRCISHIDRIVEKFNNNNNNNNNNNRATEQSRPPSSSTSTSSIIARKTKFDLGLTSTGKSLLFGTLSYSVIVKNNSATEEDEHVVHEDCSSTNNRNNANNNNRMKIDVAAKLSMGHVLSCIDAQTAHNFNFKPNTTTRIIFVEKEAVAKQLVSSSTFSFSTKTAENNILCTKGYPCLSSRMFLHRLVSEFILMAGNAASSRKQNNNNSQPQLEICFVGDCDPHGLAIIMTVCGLLMTSASSSSSNNNNSNSSSSSPPPCIFDLLPKTRPSTYDDPSSSIIKFRWIALKPSDTISSCSNSSSSPFNHRLVSWGLPDGKCMKSVLTSLEKHATSTNILNNSSTMMMSLQPHQSSVIIKRDFVLMLLKEARIMNQKKIKLELEALKEELVSMIEKELL